MNKDKLKYTERKHIYELLFGGEEKNRSYGKCPEPRKGVIDTNKSLCDSCTNNGCILQSGIIRNHCDFYKTESGECGMTYKENELYREIEIFLDDIKVGEAEIDLKGKMLSRLAIYEPYQNKNIGTQVVTDLTERYGLTNLWVNADNERAIHVYEKCGYKKVKPAMYLMKRSEKE